jgi:hypothetical protein
MKAVRARNLRGTLDPKIRAALDLIGFAWDEEAVLWVRELARALSLGGVPVPPSSKLGRWLAAQRALAEKGELEPDRERRLGEAGLL